MPIITSFILKVNFDPAVAVILFLMFVGGLTCIGVAIRMFISLGDKK
jgi:hypothetical protein